MFGAVTELVTRVSRNAPVLFLVDDLHWADEGTLLLLSHVAQFVPALPVMVVATCRDFEPDRTGHLTRTLDELIRRHLVERITLSGLPISTVAEMLRALSGREPPDAVVRLFHSDTEGNPFFVEELFRHLREQGKLFDSAGEFRSELKLGTVDVPQNLKVVIGRNLARLSDATLKALGAAAVVGRSFTFDLLAESTKAAPDSLLDCIEEAEAAGLIVSTLQYPQAQFRFSHELIRQQVMARLSVARRQLFHLDIADAIERLHPNELEDHANDLAHHLWQAGSAADAAKTARFLAIAGRRAVEQGALANAEAYYLQAVDVLATEEQTPFRDQRELNIQLALGRVLIATRGYIAPETDKAYNRASVLGERLGDPMKVVPTLLGIFSFSLLRANMEATRALAERVRAATERDNTSSRLIWGDFLRGVAAFHSGNLFEARDCLDKAIARYDQKHHFKIPQDPGTEALGYGALTRWHLGMADSARRLMGQAASLAERLRKPYALVHIQFYDGYLSAHLREPKSARTRAESVIRLGGTEDPAVLRRRPNIAWLGSGSRRPCRRGNELRPGGNGQLHGIGQSSFDRALPGSGR